MGTDQTFEELSLIRKTVGYLAYPFVMVVGMGAAFFLAGLSLQSPYRVLWSERIFGETHIIYFSDFHKFLIYFVPVLFAASCVYLLEKVQPFSKSWRPQWKENIASDLGLFVLNNVILRAEFFVALAMAATVASLQGITEVKVWPSHWPFVLQVALLLVIAEFFTYWLHRLEHEHFFLWRIHCVHHNPKRLYWLNATRFHFIDIVAIPLLTNVPVIALGASIEVIYLTTTFSVMHGFWQHGNVHTRYGFLNYLVSSSDLHRWHHYRDTAIANHNYGSNLIIWDLVFGTWYLPKENIQADAVGVDNMEAGGVVKQFFMPVTVKTENEPS
jgi:sterol desaturase/sphingolipid hydroxylase (fatty acid hydroxylase superfamily)